MFANLLYKMPTLQNKFVTYYTQYSTRII